MIINIFVIFLKNTFIIIVIIIFIASVFLLNF